MDPQSLAEALSQLRRYDPERWRTTLFAPAPLRSRLVALYAFNVEIARVRETVSEAILGQIRLQWWREALAEIAAGGPFRKHPIVDCVAAAKLDLACLERAIDARERDLDDAPFSDLAALEAYAEASSGSIFEAAFLAADADPGPAKALGTGYALAGLLRAVPFFARQRRCLLPADLLASSGLDVEAVFEGKAGPAIAACIEPIAIRAGKLLGTNVPRSALLPALPAAIAKLSLRRLAKSGFDPFAPSLQTPHPGDIWRLLFARLSGRL